MSRIKVIIVDDSATIRGLFAAILNAEADIEVVATATDPLDAREKIKQFDPDVVTLDIEMPKMDGIAFLEKIMTLRPMPVVMASSLTAKGAEVTLRALELGAVDYLFKSAERLQGGGAGLREELVEKVRVAASAKVREHAVAAAPITPLPFRPWQEVPPVIALGASTGGVEALRDLFMALPAQCPPIVITQHMPAAFTKSFAARLDKVSEVTVAEAYTGALLLLPGHAWLAPGDSHLKLIGSAGNYRCALDDGPTVSGHRPSVDVMFESVARHAGRHSVGVLLTGMGRDGAEGMARLHKAGAHTIAQDAESCVVHGMPRAAVAAGGVDLELPLHAIAAHLVHHCSQERSAAHGTHRH